MTKRQFTAALKLLELNHSMAARVLGIGRASVLRYAAGEPVPAYVERLIEMFVQHGVPEEWRCGS